MVTLPKDFVATQYPGYFWNVVERKLYTLKVTGELRPMAFSKGGWFYGRAIEPGYRVSVKGQKRTYTMSYLNTLQPTNKIQEIRVVK